MSRCVKRSTLDFFVVDKTPYFQGVSLARTLRSSWSCKRSWRIRRRWQGWKMSSDRYTKERVCARTGLLENIQWYAGKGCVSQFLTRKYPVIHMRTEEGVCFSQFVVMVQLPPALESLTTTTWKCLVTIVRHVHYTIMRKCVQNKC